MPASEKKRLRQKMKERRNRLFQVHLEAGSCIADLFFADFNLPDQAIVGGYWPIDSELDTRPLLHKLAWKNFTCALPCITPEGLVFRLWTPEAPLHKREFDVFEPLPSAPLIVPTVLLVPLLAFDCEGHRLGYGQGHYDRYLHQHNVSTIGLGFKGQEVERIPRQPHDFALNYILTEEGFIKKEGP